MRSLRNGSMLLSGGRGAVLRTALLLFVGVAAFAPPVSAKSLEAAKERIGSFRARLAGKRLVAVPPPPDQAISKSSRVSVAVVEGTDEKVILRNPWRGTEQGVRVHNALVVLTHELHRPDWVPPAASIVLEHPVGNHPAGTQLMVVEHAGPAFVNASDMQTRNGINPQVNKLSDKTRVLLALVDLLSRQLDRLPRNLLFKPNEDDVRLIDHDVSNGAKQTHKKVYGSVFFPGNALAYQVQQNRFEDLPERAQRVVKKIVERPIERLVEIYGLNAEEAAGLKQIAASVKAHGLTAAIQQFRQQFPGMWEDKKQQKQRLGVQ